MVEMGRRQRVLGWLLGRNKRATRRGFQVCGIKNFVDRVVLHTQASLAGDPQGWGMAL